MRIEDLHIGMKVTEVSPITHRESPAMVVTGIFKGITSNGDCVYLEFENGHEGDPWECHPKDLRDVKE